MKKSLLALLSVIAAAGMASASNDFSYTATAGPAANPDGIDVLNGNAPVDAWQETVIPGTSGGAGSYGNGGWGGTGWYLYSYNDATGGTVQERDTFAGGALAIGQTVSLMWGNANILTGQQVGLSILDGSGNQDIIFSFTGGDSGGQYRYTDASVTGQESGYGFQYYTMFNVAFTVTGANTYSATAGTASWTGTFTGSLSGIEVFNNAAGDSSDVGFNALTVIPEPSTMVLVSAGTALLVCYQRRKALRA